MDALKKGTKVKIRVNTDWIESLRIDFDSDKVIRTTIRRKKPPFETVLNRDIPMLDDYDNTDIRLTYNYKGKDYESDKIKKMFLTRTMEILHDKGIEINLNKDNYYIETENRNYYIEVPE